MVCIEIDVEFGVEQLIPVVVLDIVSRFAADVAHADVAEPMSMHVR